MGGSSGFMAVKNLEIPVSEVSFVKMAKSYLDLY